jgi:cysteine desulfurase
MSARIYLDHNATTPVSDDVRNHLLEWVESWGNPSSIHGSGRGPKTLLREAREKIAKFIGASPLELIFTAGGSEANNFALKGVFESFQNATSLARSGVGFRNHYLLSAVEHPSLIRTADYLRGRGAQVDFIPVGRDGRIDLEAYGRLLSDDVALVSVMMANNETGHLFPIREMAEMAHAHGALFHTDAVQALGKIPIDVRELNVDLASFVGHKFYSLKGAGVLYSRKGLNLEPLIHGGGQERHRRGGTENALAIAALGMMSEQKEMVAVKAEEMGKLRDHFEARVLAEIPFVTITGPDAPRLPNTSSLVISGVDGEMLLMNLDIKGFSVSTGAACSSGSPEPSPVLLAMGLSRAEAQSSLRVGLGWSTTLEQIDLFTDALIGVVDHLRIVGGFDLTTGKNGESYVHP